MRAKIKLDLGNIQLAHATREVRDKKDGVRDKIWVSFLNDFPF